MPSSHNNDPREIGHRLRNWLGTLYRAARSSNSTGPLVAQPCAGCASALETPCAACNSILSIIHEMMEFWERRHKLFDKIQDAHKVVRRDVPVANDSCRQCQQPTCRLCRSLLALIPADAVTRDGRPPGMFDDGRYLMCTWSYHVFMRMNMSTRDPFPTLHFGKPLEGLRERNSHMYGTVDRVPYISVLAVRPVVQNEEEVHYRSILPHSVDIDFVKRNIETCVNEHERCRTSEEQADGLRVIDCESQHVVPAPERCRYIALSYVWGAKPEGATVGFPQVVRDSITVTKALGCRYIWVDRYCIDQEDIQKQEMFNQMHRVYSNAYLTIIAAAGRDADHGLPGVSFGRPNQIKFQLGDLQFDEVFPSDNLALTNSAWATRAWTYQECYFSRRRLCFTEKQVLWICNVCTQAECISRSRSTPETHHAETSVPLPRREVSLIIQDLQNDIRLYTARLLSYSSDSLNAVLGVLQYYVELTTEPQHLVLAPGININHAWGVPLYRVIKSQEILFDLGWRHLEPGTRRPELPSWSWAGWAGQIHFYKSVLTSEIDWSFMTNRHVEVPRDAFHNQTFQGDGAPRGLVITTKVWPVTLWDNITSHGTRHTTSSRFRVVFRLTETVYAGIEWAPDEVPDAHGDYLAASLWHEGKALPDRCLDRFAGQLILRRRGQDFERIGISHMPKDIDPDWVDQDCIYFDAAGNILDLSKEDKKHLKEQGGNWWWYEHAETQRICIF